jgi:CheY-like chemotaxis protein
MTKIMIVDDDADVCTFLSDELTEVGYHVTTYSNGADAVVAAAENDFDLAVLDMLMPGLDGIQTIRVMRKVAPSIAIIGLTGYIGRSYISETSALGINCLSKPIIISALLEEINRLLKN